MNRRRPRESWTEANQAFLAGEFARLKTLLGAASTPAGPLAPLDPPSAIDRLAALFGLTSFERDVLLLCAGLEMDAELAARWAEAAGGRERGHATFGLALAALPGAHWSALTPTRPLRHFHLVEVDPARGLASAPLRIDERILHHLAGIDALDARLEPLLQESGSPDWIAEEHRAAAARAVRVATAGAGTGASISAPAVLHFCGDDAQGQEDAAAAAAQEMGRRLFILRAEDLPAPGPELDLLRVLWDREARLSSGALLIQCGWTGFTPAARHLAERAAGPLFLAGREPLRLNRAIARFEVDKPPAIGQRRLWERALGPRSSELNGTLDHLAEQFRLSARTIFTTGGLAAAGDAPLAAADLWNSCRSLAQPRLEDLAQRLVPSAGWDDLVLPEAQKQTLRRIASQVRHRLKVHETWGFAAQGRRGLGVSALFSGESGTGKTMAAEVLAGELELDLYRIDLSAVVSKYIGETEKNLRKVFEAAEDGGVLLLFDEADALFGRRSEVKDSHDRYANIEVSYLLQRIEAFQGLAILTTNLKSSLDRAFQRRIRFSVTFPFPDAAQREAIWSRVFPAKTPTRRLDPRRLSQLNVAGGHIRNIALNAAFLAAEDGNGRPVEMEHVYRAAQSESEKIERPLSAAETKGWI